MSRSSATVRTVPRRAVRAAAGRRKPVAGKSGNRVAAVRQVPQKQQAKPEMHAPVDADEELYEEVGWDYPGESAQGSPEARRRIEMLREEHLLQMALRDTFDL